MKLVTLIFCLAGTLLVSCTQATSSPTPSTVVVTLNQSAYTTTVGRSFTLTASAGSVTWTSGDTTIATVNSSGVVTGVADGTTTISAASGVSRAQCTVTVASKAVTYSLDDTNSQITWLFDPTTWAADLTAKSITAITTVEVRGSYNGWSSTNTFGMTKGSDGVWKVTGNYSAIKQPGNSGFPEFKFVVNGSTWMDGTRSFVPSGYIFNDSSTNHIVVASGTDLSAILANIKISSTVKALSDFDLTTTAGQQTIANFRQVPGGTKLFRSYHPFKASNFSTQYATESTRLSYVSQLYQKNNIGAIICLSGDETATLTTVTSGSTSYTETIPAFVQNIITAGNVLYVSPTPSYNTVYYASNGSTFGGYITSIVQWINTHTGPFVVHCRLGTDRTGVICAMLAALQGASWSDIAADYQSSNNMGIKQFRDYKILKYSFENMLQVSDVSTLSAADLQAKTQAYFINGGYLSQADITSLIAKLK